MAFEAGAFAGSPVGAGAMTALAPYKLENFVIEGFDVVEDGDRQDLGPARDVAADHQHDPEFAHGMGKGQNRSGQKPAPRQWQRHRKERIPRGRAQGPRGFKCRAGH